MTVTRFHGMSAWSWRVVERQGRLRPAYSAQNGERVFKVIEGDGKGFVYFCSSADMAAIYAGGDPRKRLPTLAGRGRWKLTGGVANRDGVVIAGDFEPGELTWTHRPGSHEEWVSDRPVDAARLRVVAYISKGSNVFDAVRRGELPPPLSAADQERLEAIGKDAPICWPGPRIADLEAAKRPLRLLHSLATGKAPGDVGARINPERVAASGGDWQTALDQLTANS